jgi:lysophospholipase L1-like esterase
VKEILADGKPAAIVVMLGLNDRVPLRVRAPPHPAAQPEGKEPTQANQPAQKQEKGKDSQQAPPAAEAATAKESGEGEQPTAQAQPGPGIYDFHTDDWAKLYRKRVDDMIAALKSKGVPVLWIGLPALRGPHATADMSYLDDLYRASADKAAIDYVDVWNGFVDENGRYSVMGPDFEGQTRRLRSGDGVHFTKYGALKLAHLVDQDLSRALANPVAPAAPSAPQAAAPPKPGAAQPAVGPVLPLTGPGGTRLGGVGGAGQSGQLLGGSQPVAADPNSAAAGVLVRGDPLPAPAGRADNFAWPPPANETNGPTKQ